MRSLPVALSGDKGSDFTSSTAHLLQNIPDAVAPCRLRSIHLSGHGSSPGLPISGRIQHAVRLFPPRSRAALSVTCWRTKRRASPAQGRLPRLQGDAALEGVSCVIFDEFHERSLNADQGLARVWTPGPTCARTSGSSWGGGLRSNRISAD